MERMETIMGLAEAGVAEALTANEVEERLIEEVRRLGNKVMREWAIGSEAAAGEQLKQTQSGVRLRKKKN